MSNSLGLTVPIYVAPAAWHYVSVDPGLSAYPGVVVPRTGLYVTDQTLLDDLVAYNATATQPVVFLQIPPMGYSDSRVNDPNAYYPTPALLAELIDQSGAVADGSATAAANSAAQAAASAAAAQTWASAPGFVILPFGSPVPSSPVAGTVYLRKTTQDTTGTPDANRQATPSVAAVGAPGQGSLGAAITLTVPSSAVAGDLLVMALALAPGATGEVVTMPTGWTQRITGSAGTSSWDQMEVWTKTCLSSDIGASVTVTASVTSGKWCGVILDCTGGFNNASAVVASTTGTKSYTTPTLSIGTSDLVLAFVSDRGAGVSPNDGIPSDSWTMASGYTQEVATMSTPQTSGNVSLMVAESNSLLSTSAAPATFTGDKQNTRGTVAVMSLQGA